MNSIKIDSIDDTKMDIKRLVVIDKENILFGGRFLNGEDIVNKNFDAEQALCLLYSNLKNWKISNLGNGRIGDLNKTINSLYAVKIKSSKHSYGLIDSSFIYKSIDNGQHWDELSRFSFYVKNVFFENNNKGFVLCREQNNNYWSILMTNDGGENWNEISRNKVSDFDKAILEKGILYFASVEGIFCRLFTYNGELKHLTELQLPNGFIVRDIAIKDNLILLAGVQNDSITILRKEDFEFKVINKFKVDNFTPDKINISNNKTLQLVISKIYGLGTLTKLLFSQDNGNNWTSFDPPIANYFNPYNFFEEEVVAYGGDGKVQIVKAPMSVMFQKDN